MIRKIVEINEELCNGCGACANACHEHAIVMIDGKAKLVKDDYCDGLGDCLPACPADAIRIVKREAADYDEAAVKARIQAQKHAVPQTGHVCPGSMSRVLKQADTQIPAAPAAGRTVSLAVPTELAAQQAVTAAAESQLQQWPVQIKLMPVRAPYFDQAKLLIAADCTAFAYARFHEEFIKGHITLVGCPKLDEGDYSEKLEAVIRANDIRSIRIVRMEVPCCGGLEHAAVEALRRSGKMIPWQVVTITCDGRIKE